MRNLVYLPLAWLLLSANLFAQSVGIADHEIVPHPSAALEILSTSKGLLIPRLTLQERNAISSPAEGLLIYQSNSGEGFYYFDGASWIAISSSSNDLDKDPQNEIQTISISGDTIYLSDGGYIKLPEVAPGTDNQKLSLKGDSLYISNSNYVLLTPVKDNLGNHSATQNIRLNSYYLSADGDNEGLRVGTNGNVELSHSLTVNGTSNLNNLTVTGTVNLGTNAVQSAEIDASSVTTSKIADNSITTAKIGDAQITASKLHPMGASTDQVLRFNGTSWAPASISTGLNYAGTWNAATNTPVLSNVTGANGTYYIVSVAGSQNLGSGIIAFNAGDWAIHNGTSYQKINNSNDVNSVFGRTGTITSQIGDYTWNQINKSTSNIDDIANVDAPSATAGNLLIANGSNWVSTVPSGDITVNGSGNFQIRNGILQYGDLRNATGAANTILHWNGTAWEEALITSIEGDASPTNELQNLSLSGTTLSISSGNSVNLSPIDAQTISFTSPNLSISGGNSVSLSAINTDNQDLSLSGNTLSLTNDATTVSLAGYIQNISLSGNTLSLSGDATTVNLAPYLDNTDAQTLSFTSPSLSISGGNAVNLSAINTDGQTLTFTSPSLAISGGNSVDLSSLIGTDNQSLTFASPNLSISGGNSVNLSVINTDNQDLSLSGNTLSLTNDATTVSLAGYIQDLSLSGNTLSLSGDATTVSLAPYLDNTDAQTLSFTSPSLSISGGNAVNLSAINTDNQDLTLSGTTLSLTNDATTVSLASFMQNLSLTGNVLSLTGDATTVDLTPINTDAQTLSFTSPSLTISGGNSINLSAINTDNQDLTLTGNILSLTNDATTVNLAPYLDNTDDQDLTLTGNTLSLTNDATSVSLAGYIQDLSLSGNTLSLSGDATSVSLAPYLDNTDAQTLNFTSPSLTISGGNAVNLSAINTDGQTLTFSSPNLSISGGNTVDLSTLAGASNQTLTFTSPTISISGGNSVNLSAINTDNQDLSLSGNTLSLTNDATTVSLAGYIQDLSLSGNTLSLSADATTVNLAPYLDNTDGQTLTFTSPNLTIAGGNTVDLTALIGTDNQSLTFSSPNLSISGGNSVNLSALNTDNQDLSLSGTTLSLTNDATTISLASFMQNLSLTGNVLSLTGDASTVDLSPINTDAQSLTFASPNLSISGGNSVNLSAIITDNQDLSLSGNTLSLTNDATTVSLAGYIQDLSLSGNTLSLSGDATTVDLSSINTDNQTLNFVFPNLTITGGNTVDLSSLATPSDFRLKENLIQSKYGLQTLMNIKVYDYNFIGSQDKHTGFIAQELYTTYPEAVKVGGDDPKTQPWMVDYSKLTPLLTKAVQELNVKVEILENDNQLLREENEALKTKLEKVDENEARLKTLEDQVNLLLQAQSQVK
jgi:hypothetical protein